VKRASAFESNDAPASTRASRGAKSKAIKAGHLFDGMQTKYSGLHTNVFIHSMQWISRPRQKRRELLRPTALSSYQHPTAVCEMA